MTTKTKVKIGAAAVAVILLSIVLLQNTGSVETRILFTTVTMSRAILLLLALLVGFAVGLLAALAWGSRKGSAR